MKKTLILLNLLIINNIIFATSAFNTITLSVKKFVRAEKSVIYLYDILDTTNMDSNSISALPNLELCSIRKSDYKRTYDIGNIIPTLLNKGLKIKVVGKSTTTIIMGHQIISGEYLKREVINFLKDEYPNIYPDKKIQMNVKSKLKNIKLPKGNLFINFEFANTKRIGNVIVNAEIYLDDELYYRKAITTYIGYEEYVYRLTHSIPSKKEITIYDLEKTKIDVAKLHGEPITNIDELTNKRSRCYLRKDKILMKKDLENIPLISFNDKIIVRYSSGNINIIRTGYARQKGGLGDIIRVKIKGKNKMLKCKVVAKGEVIANY